MFRYKAQVSERFCTLISIMQLLTLALLPLLVSITLAEDGKLTDTDKIPVTEKEPPVQYFSSHSKEMADKLTSIMTTLDNSYQDAADIFRKDNEVLDIMKKYRKAYDASKDTNCKNVAPPPNKSEDDKFVVEGLNDCEDKLIAQKWQDLEDKIDAAMDIVKDLDDTLEENQATCATDKPACEKTKQKILAQMFALLSDEQASSYKEDADEALSQVMDELKACFKETSKKFIAGLNEDINSMNACVSKGAAKGA